VASYLPVSDIKFHPENPRTITRERLDDLKRSIVTKGFYEPMLVWRRDNIVLSGNHRTRAALELIDEGFTFVNPNGDKNSLPVVIEDVTEELAEAILYESNNHYAEWVEQKLAEALAEAKTEGKNLMDFGFTTKQVDDLLAEALKGADKETTEVAGHTRTLGGATDNEIPEVTRIRVKTGSTWKLGDHILVCGDGNDESDVAKLMGEEQAALAFGLVPPDEVMCGAGFLAHARSGLIATVLRATVHAGVVDFGETPYLAAAAAHELKLLSRNIWHHGILKKSGAMFPVAHTFILVFGKTRVKLSPVVDLESTENTRALSSVLDIPKEGTADLSVGVPEAYIQACTKEGDIVLDPFADEGSTLIACQKHGRRARVLVIEPKAAQTLIDRWELYSGAKATLQTPTVLKAKKKKSA
jgi:hypothetical protein